MQKTCTACGQPLPAEPPDLVGVLPEDELSAAAVMLAYLCLDCLSDYMNAVVRKPEGQRN